MLSSYWNRYMSVRACGAANRASAIQGIGIRRRSFGSWPVKQEHPEQRQQRQKLREREYSDAATPTFCFNQLNGRGNGDRHNYSTHHYNYLQHDAKKGKAQGVAAKLSAVPKILLGQNTQPAEELMLEMTQHLHSRKCFSRNFGEVYETYVISHRVWFQQNRIILGEFDDFKPAEEYCRLAKIPNEFVVDHRGEIVEAKHLLEEENKLHSILPLPAAAQLADSFFTYWTEEKNFPALHLPGVYSYLPRVSSMVRGLSFLRDHDGLCIDYEWGGADKIDQFRYDLYVGIKVLEALEELRPTHSVAE